MYKKGECCCGSLWKPCLISWLESIVIKPCRKCMQDAMAAQCDRDIFCNINFRQEFYNYLGVPSLGEFCVYALMIPIGPGCNPNATDAPDICKNETGSNGTST